MSKDVEQRVVEMRFDNAQFERGIAQSQASLAAFNKSLGELGGSTTGIASFASALKGISFEPINNSIQIGIGKLSALTAALTGVSNIADSIYGKVTGMIRSMSGIDNLVTGWNKYATKTEAIQTIMAATRKEGEDSAEAMSRVNKQIEQLAWFADETSYSMNDMTTAVGNFTSAGVDLEVATEGVQGIALWAASAGVSTKKAATAFTQLAQAMGRGVLKRDDWAPLETLNMPTMEFKKQALEIAAELKTLNKEGDKFYTLGGELVEPEKLRESLKEGWFTTEVMNEIFKRYGAITKKVREISEEENKTASQVIQDLKKTGVAAGEELSLRAMELGQEAKTFQEAMDSITDAASSKFTDIFESVFGNYLQAKELWTDLANGLYEIFVTPLELVRDAFKSWSEAGGRLRALTAVKNAITEIWSVFTMFRDTWDDIFGDKEARTRKKLDTITKALALISSWISKVTTSIKENQAIFKNIRTFGEGIKSLLEALKKVASEFFGEISKRFSKTGDASRVVEWITIILAKIGELASKIAEFINKSKVIQKAFDLFDTVGKKLKDTFKSLGEVFSRIFENRKDRTIIWQLGNDAVEFKSPLETVRDILKTIIDLSKNLIMQLTPMVAAVWSFIKSIISFLGGVVSNFAPLIEKAFGMLTTGITEATKTMTDYFNSAEFTNPFELIASLIKKIAESIGTFISFIIDGIVKIKQANPEAKGDKKSFLERMGEGIVNFAELLYAHREAIEWMQATLFGNQDMITVMLNIATALGKLFTTIAAGTIVVVGVIKIFNWIFTVLSNGQGGLFTKVTAVMSGLQSIYGSLSNIMGKFANAKLIKSFAALMWSIAGSLFILALIPSEELVRSAVVMAVAIAIIGGAIKMLLKMLDDFDDTIGEYETYEDGAFSMTNRFFSKGARSQTKRTGKTKGNKLMGLVALIAAIGAACLMMATSVAIIGSVTNWDSAAVAFAGLILFLGAVTGILFALKQMNFEESDNATIGMIAVLILAIGVAMKHVGKAVSYMANMSVDSVLAATGCLLIVLAAMVAITLFASYLEADESSLRGMATLITSLGFMFLGVAIAMKIAASIHNLEEAIPLIFLMSAIAAAILILAASAVKLVENIQNGFQVAALAMVGVLMLNMVGVILAIGLAVVAIGVLVPEEKITAATLAVASIISIIGLIMLLATMEIGNGASLKQMLAFAGAFALMGIAVLSFVPAFLALKDLNFGQIMGVTLAIALLVGILVGASALIGKFEFIAGGLILFAGAMVAMSVSALIFSASVIIIAVAVTMIVDAFKEFVELGPAAGEQIRDVMKAFGEGIVDLFRGIGQGFVEMFKTLVDNRSTLVQYAGTMMGVFIEALMGSLPALMDYIRLVLEKILELLWAFGPGILEFTLDQTEQLIDGIFDTIIRLGPKLNKAVTTLVKTALLEILGLIEEVVPQLIETVVVVIIDTLTRLMNSVNELGDAFFDAMESMTENLTTRMPEIVGQWTSLGVSITSGWIIGMIEGIFKNIPDFVDKAAKAFVEMVDKLCPIIEENWEPVYEAMVKLIKTALNAVSEFCGRLAYDLVGDGKNPIWTACCYITDGFKRGFAAQRNKRAMENTGKFIASTFEGGFKEQLDINSPSKVMEQNGQFCVDGLLMGISSKFGAVKTVAAELGNTLKTQFSGTLGNMAERFKGYGSAIIKQMFGNIGGIDVQEMFSGVSKGGNFLEGINLNPTITPSLDLSQVQSQASGLDSLFAGNQVKAIADVQDWNSSQVALENKLNADSALENKMQLNSLMDGITKLINIEEYNAENPSNVNVTLAGDAGKMLKLLKIEDLKNSKASGLSAFQLGKSAGTNTIKLVDNGFSFN